MLVALESAPVASPAFHPAEGAMYRCETSETRDDRGDTQHFHAARHIVFRREGDGYLAEVTIDAADQSGPQSGSAFLAGNRALLGRAIRVHIDGMGRVTVVDDADALFDRMVTGIEAASRAIDPKHAAATVAPLRAFDAAGRQAMLGSAVADLIRPGDVARAAGTRPVSLPSRPPMSPGSRLPAMETVRRDGDTVSIVTHGAGPISVGGVTVPGTASGTMTLDMMRRVDLATGLVMESRSTRAITTASGARSSRAETITTLRLGPKTP